jgi:Do/DeqQ family serine protease
VVKAVQRVGPAVVNISSEFSGRKQSQPFSGFGLNPLFEHFFRDFFDPHPGGQPERNALGSGVIIDGKKGLIITNAHVIANTGNIRVVLQDERAFEAEIVGADLDFDLAVLRIHTDKHLPDIAMGSSEDLMIGETVIAIGNPFGFSNTVTTGVISALNRSIRTENRTYHEFIQIDASINPGNSGGPLLNINGELIGINTAIYAKAQGIGFAIPISKANKIISDLIEHGEVLQSWIGVTVQNIDANLARYLNTPNNGGVIVKQVQDNSPAERAGIYEGDIIVTVEKRAIHSDEDYQTAMRSHSAGRVLPIRIWRDKKMLNISVTPENFPMETAGALADRLLGVRVTDIATSRRLQARISPEGGVTISAIRANCYLARIGARKGDVIRRINDHPIKNKEDFLQAVVKYRHKNTMVLIVQRGNEAYYVTVEVSG